MVTTLPVVNSPVDEDGIQVLLGIKNLRFDRPAEAWLCPLPLVLHPHPNAGAEVLIKSEVGVKLVTAHPQLALPLPGAGSQLARTVLSMPLAAPTAAPGPQQATPLFVVAKTVTQGHDVVAVALVGEGTLVFPVVLPTDLVHNINQAALALRSVAGRWVADDLHPLDILRRNPRQEGDEFGAFQSDQSVVDHDPQVAAPHQLQAIVLQLYSWCQLEYLYQVTARRGGALAYVNHQPIKAALDQLATGGDQYFGQFLRSFQQLDGTQIALRRQGQGKLAGGVAQVRKNEAVIPGEQVGLKVTILVGGGSGDQEAVGGINT